MAALRKECTRYGVSLSLTFSIDLANGLAAFKENCTPYSASGSCVSLSLSMALSLTHACSLALKCIDFRNCVRAAKLSGQVSGSMIVDGSLRVQDLS